MGYIGCIETKRGDTMKEAKYTKGKWKIEQSRSGWDDDVSIIGGDGTFVAQVKWINDNQEANARLISAAPDLLEALQELTDLFEATMRGEYEPDSFTTQPARNAISKSLGSQSL